MASVAGVVLAGGKGTRLNSPTPKVLHRVCGREIISYVVEAAQASGCAPVVAVVPPVHEAFRSVLGASVSYAVQSRPLGSGHALLSARQLVEQSGHVAVFNGDWPLVEPATVATLIRHHLSSRAAVTLLTSELKTASGMGRIVRDSQGEVRAVVEELEANQEVRAIREVNAGLYCFDGSWVWDAVDGLRPSERKGEIYLTDLVSKAASEGQKVTAVRSDRPYVNFGVNTREQLAETEAALRERLSPDTELENGAGRAPARRLAGALGGRTQNVNSDH